MHSSGSQTGVHWANMSERKETRIIAPVGLILVIDGHQEACVTRNISKRGMFVMTRRIAPEGTRVEISLVREGIRLSTKAEVVTVADDGLGLRYDGSSDEFLDGIDALLDDLLQRVGDAEAKAPDHQAKAEVSWASMPDGTNWNWWQKRKRKADLVELSLDGAALRTRKTPEVGETILVFLESPTAEEDDVYCQAEVVRMIDRGFAVRFISPSIPFRRTITELRRRESREI